MVTDSDVNDIIVTDRHSGTVFVKHLTEKEDKIQDLQKEKKRYIFQDHIPANYESTFIDTTHSRERGNIQNRLPPH